MQNNKVWGGVGIGEWPREKKEKYRQGKMKKRAGRNEKIASNSVKL